MAQRTISWTMPTTFTDNTSITPAQIAAIKIHIFKDGPEVYTTLPGVTTFPIEVTSGVTNVWELTAELNGVQSAKSPSKSYTEPFLPTKSPIIGSIT